MSGSTHYLMYNMLSFIRTIKMKMRHLKGLSVEKNNVEERSGEADIEITSLDCLMVHQKKRITHSFYCANLPL
ncbi:hypothetical protein DNHGIG_39360 [Collibacillus ludicampi]|uniref:Uncharacterized protein n=1 Tax=Collibacillus ludicampi TaxID=2771369 RepID=A0AAV4LMT9_9BACL|nr:hypothetical protein DNHGIG_39360 [Collibacillus ludicampi]